MQVDAEVIEVVTGAHSHGNERASQQGCSIERLTHRFGTEHQLRVGRHVGKEAGKRIVTNFKDSLSETK